MLGLHWVAQEASRIGLPIVGQFPGIFIVPREQSSSPSETERMPGQQRKNPVANRSLHPFPGQRIEQPPGVRIAQRFVQPDHCSRSSLPDVTRQQQTAVFRRQHAQEFGDLNSSFPAIGFLAAFDNHQ